MLLRYQARPNYLPDKCEGCASTKPFTLQHTLQSMTEGLVIGCHNEVRDSPDLIGTQAFSS